MSAESFLDTSHFICPLEARDDRNSAIADFILREGVATRNPPIGYRVVQECLSIIRRKAEVPEGVSGARAYRDHALRPLLRVLASVPLGHRGLDIHGRYHFGVCDSLIIAAALESGCTRLLTEDLPHGRTIETLPVMNPFAKT